MPEAQRLLVIKQLPWMKLLVRSLFFVPSGFCMLFLLSYSKASTHNVFQLHVYLFLLILNGAG